MVSVIYGQALLMTTRGVFMGEYNKIILFYYLVFFFSLVAFFPFLFLVGLFFLSIRKNFSQRISEKVLEPPLGKNRA